jgi:hypothetical protein
MERFLTQIRKIARSASSPKPTSLGTFLFGDKKVPPRRDRKYVRAGNAVFTKKVVEAGTPHHKIQQIQCENEPFSIPHRIPLFRFCLPWDDVGIVPYIGIRTALFPSEHFLHRKMFVTPRRGGCPHPPGTPHR